MTNEERLEKLESLVEEHEFYFAHVDRVLTLLADRLSWLIGDVLDGLPEEKFHALERQEILDLLDAADRGDLEARASLEHFGLTVPDVVPD